MTPMAMVPEADLSPPFGSGIPDPQWQPRVLRRTDDVGDGCPLLRSAPGFRIVPARERAEWVAKKLNMSGLVWTILSQGSVGSCASESADGATVINTESRGQVFQS